MQAAAEMLHALAEADAWHQQSAASESTNWWRSLSHATMGLKRLDMMAADEACTHNWSKLLDLEQQRPRPAWLAKPEQSCLDGTADDAIRPHVDEPVAMQV
jgi:hypothetical protein